jgi:hypothetical protein
MTACTEETKEELHYATSTHAPPASLIFASAFFEKNFALTITGWLGSTPLPSTLKYPCVHNPRCQTHRTTDHNTKQPRRQLRPAPRQQSTHEFGHVNHGRDVRTRGVRLAHVLANQGPHLVQVDARAEVQVALPVEVPHADLTCKREPRVRVPAAEQQRILDRTQRGAARSPCRHAPGGTLPRASLSAGSLYLCGCLDLQIAP